MTARLLAVVLLLLGTTCAQIRLESSDVVRRVRVKLAFSDHAPCDASTRVVLTGAMGFAVAEGSVNGECTAEFFDVPAGRYQVTVRGSDATNADDGSIEVHSVITQDVEVRAKRTSGSNATNWASAASFVSVRDLAMPAKAAKDFDKANGLIAKQDWKKATEHLQKGLEVYPKYAAGYNNLGAVYSQQGRDAEAREAFKQALALDEHLAPAYVNLARLSFLEKDYATAESLLTKALGMEPAANADELFLLGYAQLTDHHLDQAIETSREAHARFKQHAFLHLVAANAYEQENKIPESMAELQSYLSEDPEGPQAEKVKRSLAIFQSRTASETSFGSH